MKPALLVIDVQRGLFEVSPPPDDAAGVIARINTLTARARAEAVPVIWIQHQAAGSPLMPGNAVWELDPRLAPADGDHYIRKSTPDSFLNTPLAELLSSLGVERLVICGYSTEFCVDTTTRRAMALGFPVTLVGDAHTSVDKAHMSGAQIRAHHNATLSMISSFGPRTTIVATQDLHFCA